MGDILMPPQLKFSHGAVRYVDATGASNNPYTGVTRTVGLGGDRLGFALDFTTIGGPSAKGRADVAVLTALIARLKGRQNRLILPDPNYYRRGVFPTSELLPNNTFAQGTTGWTLSAEMALSESDRVLRALRSGVVSAQTIRNDAAVATTASVFYVARVLAALGQGAMDFRLSVGTSAGGSQAGIEGADHVVEELATLLVTGNGSPYYFSIVDGNSSRIAGDFMEYTYTSFSRCLAAFGTAARGSSGLTAYGADVSTANLLYTGDRFEVITSQGSELKVMTAAGSSTGTGGVYLRFSPPLRGSVAANAPIIINQPMGRFIATGTMPEPSNDPGIFTTCSIEIEEAA
jgi:hypothetical protein